MIDVFKLFHIETKEDAYTFCLIQMLESGGDEFKAKVGAQFGFDGPDYKVTRGAFKIENEKSERDWIIPDLVLSNDHQIAVIESKMFSSEGHAQTQDYEKGIASLKHSLNADNATASFYYLTLAGVSSDSGLFKAVKWSDFYKFALDGIVFTDECLELLRKTILNQIVKYNEFESALGNKAYKDLFDDERYWVTPFSIFASGAYDDVWKMLSGQEEFQVENYNVRGRGHSAFTTNLSKESWWINGAGQDDNLHLFIRIEWFSWGPVVWLCWEYFRREKYWYIAMKDLAPEFHDKAVANQIQYKESWVSDPDLPYKIQTTGKKANSIKPLKCQISGDKTISETIEDIKAVAKYYSEEIEHIVRALAVEDGYLSFSAESYKTALNS